jgi:hypothetical protein
MTHICVTSPLPTIDTIMASFEPLLTYPPSIHSIPQILPGLPSPIYPNVSAPNIELVTTAIELQSFQIQTTLMGMIVPILGILGISLSSFLPTIPGLPGMTLVDLMANNPAALTTAINNSIKAGIQIPGIPQPLYPKLNAPNFETVQTLQLVTASYMQTVAGLVVGLIGQVTSHFRIGNITGVPTLPDLATVLATVIAAGTVDGLSYPGFPNLPVLASPLAVSFNIPEIELIQNVVVLYNNMTIGFLQVLFNFIESSLSGLLSFTFPLICIDI